MNKSVLTIEESLKLTSLGVPEGEATYLGDDNEEYVFTLTDLLSILPKKITYNNFTYAPNIWVDEMGAWNVEYVTLNMPFDDIGSSVRADELIDAIYNMVVWLKTNKVKEL